MAVWPVRGQLGENLAEGLLVEVVSGSGRERSPVRGVILSAESMRENQVF